MCASLVSAALLADAGREAWEVERELRLELLLARSVDWRKHLRAICSRAERLNSLKLPKRWMRWMTPVEDLLVEVSRLSHM